MVWEKVPTFPIGRYERLHDVPEDMALCSSKKDEGKCQCGGNLLEGSLY